MAAKDLLARLIGFPTVSSASNLDCIAACILPGPRRQGESPRHDQAAVAGCVVLSGHTDMVPVEGQGWRSDPWRRAERDGTFFGRGACDMEGSVALMACVRSGDH